MSDRSSEDGSGSVACASTQAALEQFLRDRGRFRDPATRAHLAACGGCRDAYRAHVEGLARLARAQRGTAARGRRRGRPGERADVRRPAEPSPVDARHDTRDGARHDASRGVRDAALELERARGPKARSRNRVRLLVAPAVLALGFLVVQRFLPVGGTASAQAFEALPIVTPVSGNVLVSDRRLAADESALLARGASCRTAPGSRARIAAGRAELELGPETWLQVEAKAPPRFRLALGEVTVRGACTITTVHGVAEVGEGGALTIRLGWKGIAFARGAGDARWYDADGERALGDGVPFELVRALPGVDGRDG